MSTILNTLCALLTIGALCALSACLSCAPVPAAAAILLGLLAVHCGTASMPRRSE